jgi:hypothetical protein
MLALSGTLVLGTAEASLKAIEQAYELHLNQVVLPAILGGNVIVRPCAKCKPVTLSTSADSRFAIRNGQSNLALAEFIRAVNTASRGSNPMLYVYYAPEQRRVTRIVLGASPESARNSKSRPGQ